MSYLPNIRSHAEGFLDDFLYHPPSPPPQPLLPHWFHTEVGDDDNTWTWPDAGERLLAQDRPQPATAAPTNTYPYSNLQAQIREEMNHRAFGSSSDDTSNQGSGSEASSIESLIDFPDEAEDSDSASSSSSAPSTLDMGSEQSHPNANNSDPIDLTGSPSPPHSPRSPPQMPSASTTSRKRTRAEARLSSTPSSGDEPLADARNKRRRRNNGPPHVGSRPSLALPVSPPPERSSFNPPFRPPRQNQPTTNTSNRPNTTRTIEQIDLCDDDNNTDLQATLSKQRAEAVKATAISTSKAAQSHSTPNSTGNTKLTQLQCTVCLEPPTDLTATTCGHTFCRVCLLDWLSASEREPGRRPNCPACRKPLSWRGERKKDIVTCVFMKGRREVVA